MSIVKVFHVTLLWHFHMYSFRLY